MIASETRKRNGFGVVIQLAFWIWQAYCGLWYLDMTNRIVELKDNPFAGIAGVIGSAYIGWWWFIGTVSLGILVLLTRGEKVITYRRTDSTPEGTV